MLLVDDAGTDDSWTTITALADRDERIAGIRLAANVRQVRAFCAGVAAADADTVLTLDADLEVPPEALVVLTQAAMAGHDFVNGRRTGRARTRPLRAVASAIFNALVGGGRRFGVRDLGSGATAMSRHVANAVVEATEHRPTQIIKPQMVRRPKPRRGGASPGPAAPASGYSVRQLAWFALDYLRAALGRGASAADAPEVAVAEEAGWVVDRSAPRR
ncbi:MAG: glycosyltransferase [Microthrixaceae bacterium]